MAEGKCEKQRFCTWFHRSESENFHHWDSGTVTLEKNVDIGYEFSSNLYSGRERSSQPQKPVKSASQPKSAKIGRSL